ncbi:HNH endonuclease family protein [[Mycobacterium] crassicus]|uniref:HNH endonuclease family protein n=1 Tax=[Mycobacterium] crassicus TaxID=2872309 RepID=A0ABU5XPV9_9MYCO|nr:HNH endonuclease family protein [Mycolicibacter sp. MYC098]MEB3024063.1 HNH endonuclease family protein [Mycolicibacter sp. MYC098]
MRLTKPARIALIAAPVLVFLFVGIVMVVESSSTASTVVTSSYPTTSRSSAPGPTSPALAKLNSLDIKGRAPKTNYDRALFGSPWSDDVTVEGGHNGCDTRNDILRRDLAGAGFRPGRNTCIVLSGTLNDPYTGETILYQRGPGSSSQIQIDHIVPILDAWQKGAQGWDYMTRRNFANDPINLQTTTAAANREKGSGDAATWLPPNKSYRCTYANRIIDVKVRYGLWVTQSERDALARVLANYC